MDMVHGAWSHGIQCLSLALLFLFIELMDKADKAARLEVMHGLSNVDFHAAKGMGLQHT